MNGFRKRKRAPGWNKWTPDKSHRVGVEGVVIDIADAFKLIDVAPPERRFLAAEIAQKFYLWGVCIFGCASPPWYGDVWPRSSCASRRVSSTAWRRFPTCTELE